MCTKKILGCLTAAVLAISMCGVSTYALFDDEDTGSSSTSSSDVMEDLTIEGTVTRATAAALLINETSPNIGTDSVAVTWSGASNFKTGDKVKVTYSAAPTMASNAMSVVADNVELVSGSGSTTAVDTSADNKAETTVTTPTTTKTETATTTSNTPDTGNAPVTFAVTSALLAMVGIAVNANTKKKEDE